MAVGIAAQATGKESAVPVFFGLRMKAVKLAKWIDAKYGVARKDTKNLLGVINVNGRLRPAAHARNVQNF